MEYLTDRRVVITGLGVVSPIGIGKQAFWESLSKGRSGIRPVTLFDTTGLRSKLAGEISDFKPQEILGQKGLRLLDRTTRLALCASHFALQDAGFEVNTKNTQDVGVVLGSTMGSFSSRSGFYVEAVQGGFRAVNPALFPNTVVNSSASQVSIWFDIKGFNTTVSTGLTSSLEALEYGANCIFLNRVQVVLAGGVEELCEISYVALYKTGFLSGSAENRVEISAPFDKRRNGVVLGEGCVLFVLEELKHAKARGARIYAEYKGGASTIDQKAYNRYSLRATGAERAIQTALENARVVAEDIDYVASGANSTLIGDASEVRALRATLAKSSKQLVVSASKSMIGETFSASGAFQVASALLSFEEDLIPPTINFEVEDKRCLVDCVPGKARKQKVNTVLVSSVSPMCQNAACVLSRFVG